MKVAVWLDDERDPRSRQWQDKAQAESNGAERIVWADSVDAFEEEVERVVLDGDELVACMFDINLGSWSRDGHDAFAWFEGYVKEMNLPEVKLSCHSMATREERFKMKRGFHRLLTYWRCE